MSCDVCEFTDVYLNNDHTIEIDNLRGLIAGVSTQLNAATITYQIYDMDDTLIVGANGVLTAVGTGGDYREDVDKAKINLLDVGGEYNVTIVGSQSGADFEFNIPIRVKKRGKT